MSTYIITYDLMQQGQNYTCLTTRLKAYGTWCHLQGSVWIIVTTQSAAQVRDYLRACLDANDRLFVGRLSGEAAWTSHGKVMGDWLLANL